MSIWSSMKSGEGQVKIGDHLYMFLSPGPTRSTTTECMVFGHAGLATSIRGLAQQFAVPAGLTMHFYTPHGSPHYTRAMQPLGWKGKPELNVNGGDSCFNYVVIKGLGEHWSHGNKKVENDPASYQDVRVTMNANPDWHPHYVTVRNRRGVFRGKGYCTLEEIVSNLLAYSQQPASGIAPITDIYFAGCRGVHADWLPK